MTTTTPHALPAPFTQEARSDHPTRLRFRLGRGQAVPHLPTPVLRLLVLRLDRPRLSHAAAQCRPHVLPRVPARATERAVEAPPTDRPDVAGALATLEAVKRQRAAVNALCAALAAITETPKETT